MRHYPPTIDELSKSAKESCHLEKQRILRHRMGNYSDDEYKSTKYDSWDPPRIVIACGSLTYFRNIQWDYRNIYVGYRPHMADLQYCFDFYQKAMYEIMDLYELRGKKPDGSQYLYYVIDDSCAKIQFVHLRPQDGGCKMVLAREKNKYKIIENVEDVRAKKELHTLDECKAIANPENPHDFDYWLERSWLGNN